MGRTRTRLSVVSDYVALDTETTGLDTKWCDIIEVGAVKYIDGKEVARYGSLVKPRELPISQFIEDLTGITNEELEDAPDCHIVIAELRDFIGVLPIVGHNVCFDSDFINKAFKDTGFDAPNNVLIDTLRIARHVYKDMPSKKLGLLTERCARDSGSKAPEPSHRAVSDSAAAAFCYEAMKPMLIEMYGVDPENGYSKKRSSGTHCAINYKDMAPSVDEIDESNPFYGQTICFTGKLSTMERRKAAQCAIDLGAIPLQGVTKKLDYLVVGSFDFISNLRGDKSAKLKKAEGYQLDGIPLEIISEDFFLEYAREVM